MNEHAQFDLGVCYFLASFSGLFVFLSNSLTDECMPKNRFPFLYFISCTSFQVYDSLSRLSWLEARRPSEAGGEPKSKVFISIPLFYSFCLLYVFTYKSVGCNPQCGYTMELHVISYQHSNSGIDSSCCSLIRILWRLLICAPPICTPFVVCRCVRAR